MFCVLSSVHFEVNFLYHMGTNSDWHAFIIHGNRLMLTQVLRSAEHPILTVCTRPYKISNLTIKGKGHTTWRSEISCKKSVN